MRAILLGIVAAAAAVLALGAWASGFESSAAKAGRAERATSAAVQPNEFELSGGALPVRVVALLTDEENGTVAVVVEVTNPDPKRPIVGAPISIELLDGGGTVVGTNTAPGTDPVLNEVASLPPGGTVLYVNDTITPDATPTSARVEATGTPTHRALQAFEIEGAKVERSIYGTAVTGRVANPGPKAAEKVRIEAVVRRGGEIVAAGGALVDRLPPGARAEFQIFLIGNPRGELTVWAPPL